MDKYKDIIEKARHILKSEELKENVKRMVVENQKIEDHPHDEVIIDGDVEIPQSLVFEFIKLCKEVLQIEEESVKVVLSTNRNMFETYAFYDPSKKSSHVYCKNRSTLDCFRSLAHEITHFKQDVRGEITADQVGSENDGVKIENEANAVAGVIMRKFGRLNKDLYN